MTEAGGAVLPWIKRTKITNLLKVSKLIRSRRAEKQKIFFDGDRQVILQKC